MTVASSSALKCGVCFKRPDGGVLRSYSCPEHSCTYRMDDDSPTGWHYCQSPHPCPVHPRSTGSVAVDTVLAQKRSVRETLAERHETYGQYADTSAIAQALKDVIRAHWVKLNPGQREALDLIANKIARIVNGDPNHKDSWHDIAGYAQLAEDLCQ